jgi:drug/metabolite transporter (DMT)-like permease
MLPWLARMRLRGLRTGVFHLHLLRALLGVVAMYSIFSAIGRLPIAEAVLLNQSAPLFIPFIAWFWLREPVPRGVQLAIAVGFVGVALVLKPGRGVVSGPALIALLSGVTAAFSMVTMRRMSHTEPSSRIVFYFATLSTLITAIPLLWSWHTPTPTQWLMMVAIGGLATLGQTFLARGYASAPAAQVGPLTYMAVVYAAIYGWVLWGEVPDALAIGGGGLVIGAGVVTTLQRRRATRRANPAATGAG